MSLAPTLPEVFYPESDGKPMAETDIHWRLMVYIRQVLEWLYRGQKVYVGSNMLMYYVKGDPRRSVAPDDFVVKDCPPGNRRVFKTWEEGRVPNTVFEITSASTRSEDEHDKPEIYARIGVKELFLVDPTLDYLDPPLQGYRFVKGVMRPIRPDKSGALESKELGLTLRMEDGELVFYDSRTGERLLTEAEAERRAREQERDARLAAEEELRRLRVELARRSSTGE